MITQEFNLNMIPESGPVIVHVSQYDEGTGRFIINLYKGNETYTPAAGATAIIQGTKPDGKGFAYNATISGSTVTANVTGQMTVVAGTVPCQLVITESDNITGTFVFSMDVQKSALPDDTDMSESDYQVIVQAMEEAQASATSANAAMISAQISATSADAAMISAQSSADDSEAWAVGQRNGVAVDSDDETYHNNSKYYSEQAGDAASVVASKMDIDGSNADNAVTFPGSLTTGGNITDGNGNVLSNKMETDGSNAASEVTFAGAFTVGSRASDSEVGACSVVEGNRNEASGSYSHAEGVFVTASGSRSHAEGYNTTASGDTSHAEGYDTTASGSYSHAEGQYATASGSCSHAEGGSTTASKKYSHAEGHYTTALGEYSHAEGESTTASGSCSHVEGQYATASGSHSHSEGQYTSASGNYSHAEGLFTKAGSSSQHVQGKYNVEDTNDTYAHIVGGGTDNNNRANIETLDWSGNLTVAGDMTDGNGNVLSNKQENIDLSIVDGKLCVTYEI